MRFTPSASSDFSSALATMRAVSATALQSLAGMSKMFEEWFFGDDERMSAGYRMDVEKAERFIVLEYLM